MRQLRQASFFDGPLWVSTVLVLLSLSLLLRGAAFYIFPISAYAATPDHNFQLCTIFVGVFGILISLATLQHAFEYSNKHHPMPLWISVRCWLLASTLISSTLAVHAYIQLSLRGFSIFWWPVTDLVQGINATVSVCLFIFLLLQLPNRHPGRRGRGRGRSVGGRRRNVLKPPKGLRTDMVHAEFKNASSLAPVLMADEVIYYV